MSKKNNEEVIKTVDELLKDDFNYGLYTIVNTVTGFSSSIMREPSDTIAYNRAIQDIGKAIEHQKSAGEKVSNFSLVRLGVYNIETSTIISIDRLVMPLGDNNE